jgi:hypothetical protein
MSRKCVTQVAPRAAAFRVREGVAPPHIAVVEYVDHIAILGTIPFNPHEGRSSWGWISAVKESTSDP